MIQRPVAWSAVALVLVTIAVHWPALHGGFIWDDDDHLTQNAAVAAPDGWRRIWTSLAVSRYYPLTLTTFWAQRRLWDLNPLPYHAVNIALHAVNALLLYGLLRRWRAPAAWVAAALWAVHPVNVESVAWVTELKNTQSALFFFLALWCWVRFEEQPRRSWYGLALLAFAAALLSKPSTVTLPAILLLVAWWRRGRWERADWIRTAPFFALALGMSLVTVLEQQTNIVRSATPEWSLGAPARLVVAAKAWWFYAGKVFWPHPVVFVYPRWTVDVHAVRAWLPLALLAVLGLVLWRFRRESAARAAAFGLGCFTLLLLPVLGFVDVYYFRYSFVADHFNYLSSAALLALAAAGGGVLLENWRATVAPAVATAVLVVLAPLSWQHSREFRENEVLWQATLDHNPGAAIAHNNLGNICRAKGQWPQAETHFREAARLSPDYPQVHNNLGVLLAQQERYTEAIAHLQTAVRLKPDYADAWANLGRALAIQGRRPEAVASYRQAVQLSPPDADARYVLASLLLDTGRPAEALGELRAALALATAQQRRDLIQEIQTQLNRLDTNGAPRSSAESPVEPSAMEHGRDARATEKRTGTPATPGELK